MINFQANGGDGFNGGKGGDGGKIHFYAEQVIEIGNLENVIMQNNSIRIDQDFQQVLKQIDEDETLEPEQKAGARQVVEALWHSFTKAEPYARPFIIEFLKKLAAG